MSHLRAPATRAERREGGRHGRPGARPAPALPETHIRPQLMRLAVLPPLAVALSATAAVLFSIRSGGARTGPTLWAVLAGAVTVAAAGIVIAAVAADRAARSVADRVDALRRTAARGEADLHGLVDALRQGQPPPQRGPRRRPPVDADDFELLAADLARAHDGAVTAVVRAAQLSSQAGSEQKLEVFVNLARRLQSLVHREISILDDLENEIEDPDLLKGLFHVDHLATRIRRHAENLAVLGGAVSRRQWSNPVSMTEVLRSAIAEVEQYSRVKLVPPVDGELRGHAVADVIHLLAELIENATVFSAPHTQVLLRANLVTSGLAVEVEDRGLGMPVVEQNRMNAVLADPDQVNVASLLADGRIGLYVVSQLARRHHIHVRLQGNIYGGVQAVLVVPQALLGNAPEAPGTGAGAAVLPPPSLAQAPMALPAGSGTGGPGGGPAEAWSAVGAGSAPEGVPGTAGPDAGPGGRAGSGPAGQGAAAAGPDAGQAPATGRRRHAQRGSGRRGADSGARGRGGEAPAPLPVRGAHGTRPTPADAVPGVSAEDRAVVEAHAGILPTPRSGTERSTTDKPRLPRRRAQEHLVPQLRGGPVPRQDAGTVAEHDPGLMAAFQRGIGLAEAQQDGEPGAGWPAGAGPRDQQVPRAPHMDAEHMAVGHIVPSATDATEPARTRPQHGGPAPLSRERTGHELMGVEHLGPEHMSPVHRGHRHLDPPDPDGPHAELHHEDAQHTGPDHMTSPHMAPPHTAFPHAAPGTAPDRTPADRTDAEHMTPPPTAQPHTPVPAADGTRGTGRTDRSAPAG
ncbi:ATP-binding protein [Streptomyces sp. NPDC006193]|uniref:ATP-binding protein n=1 Tax=Streptomyces sp. NPDC006193 TaxID=3155717 RepID=UPI00339E4A21